MQARMKKYPLAEEKVHDLLATEAVGRIASSGADGFPYITPVHFVFLQGRIFIHGLAVGEKLNNMKNDSRVGFEVERMLGLVQDDKLPCDTNTSYESVIIRGNAALIDDPALKVAVLDAFVAKYAPHHTGRSYPDPMLKMTGVIAIDVLSCTGKYYPM
ncbi:MAG: hypothetical protein DESF_01702 [Desulfovibrio sp.]